VFLQILINSIIAGSVYSLLAFGFTLIFSTLNFFNLSHGIAFTLAAYFSYVLRIKLHLSLPLSFAFSILFTTLAMLGVYRVAYFPLRVRRAPSWVYVVGSLGVATFMEALVAFVFGSDLVSLRTGETQPGYLFGNAVITQVQLWTLGVSIVAMIVLSLLMKRTRLGKAMRAVANDGEMSGIVGIQIERICLFTFGLGAAVTAIAGNLVSLEQDLFPTMGQAALLKAIVAASVGASGSIPGALFGGFFLGVVENFGIWHINASWKDGIALALLIFFILFRPKYFGVMAEK
jgi:branched-chain amino acid transport system permease protein